MISVHFFVFWVYKQSRIIFKFQIATADLYLFVLESGDLEIKVDPALLFSRNLFPATKT